MSNHIVSLVFKRKVGRPALKQVLSYMADKASDDGSGVWCAKTTIADETELSKTAVKQCIHELSAKNLIVEVGKRKCANGFTIEYAIILDSVEALSPTESQLREWAKKGIRGRQEVTPSGGNPVTTCPPQGREVTPSGSGGDPKPSITIQEPPTRASEREAHGENLDHIFDEVWRTYPKDRRRNHGICFREFEQAVAGGHDPKLILKAVKKFGNETSGYTRSKVKFSDNWFKEGAWQRVDKEINEAKVSSPLCVCQFYGRSFRYWRSHV